MLCAERQLLFEAYHLRVNAHCDAVAAMRDPYRFDFRDTRDDARVAHAECENARLNLERHEREHG